MEVPLTTVIIRAARTDRAANFMVRKIIAAPGLEPVINAFLDLCYNPLLSLLPLRNRNGKAFRFPHDFLTASKQRNVICQTRAEPINSNLEKANSLSLHDLL